MTKKEIRSFKYYRFKNRMKAYARIIYWKLFKKFPDYPKKLGGKPVLSQIDGVRKITELIESGKPFCVVRYGAAEMEAACAAKKVRMGIDKEIDPQQVLNLQNNAGFFPLDTNLLFKFDELMDETSRGIDVLATFRTQMEDYMIKNYLPKHATVIPSRSLDPHRFQHREPWSKALKGKKVLIIHPFVDTMRKQYENREFLFEDKDVLPDFELLTLKAVQTVAGEKDDRFADWFEALDYMFNEAMKMDFDIAILGCGAYGPPLTVKLRNAGKQAIYMGGSLQLLFGIKGRRWDLGFPEIVAMYNDYWVRPSAEETPKHKEKNEAQGAYW